MGAGHGCTQAMVHVWGSENFGDGSLYSYVSSRDPTQIVSEPLIPFSYFDVFI